LETRKPIKGFVSVPDLDAIQQRVAELSSVKREPAAKTNDSN
jgi:hypothetical protein